MNKKIWNFKTVMAAFMCATFLIGGQAEAATTSTASTVSIQSVSKGQKVINAGKKYLGTPYKYASSRSTKTTMDCSEFAYWAFKEGAGINIGKGGARGQYSNNGKKVSYDNLKVGDLVFFSTSATMKYPKSSIKRIGHVGIYAGNHKVLHTFGKGGVRFSDMGSGWWKQHFVAAKRVL